MWWGICTLLGYKFPTESKSERILKIGQYLVKLWARVKCLVFWTHGVDLHYYNCIFVFSKFNTWLRVRGSALRLAIAPEFFLLFLYTRILYVYSDFLKYNVYVCMM